MTTPSDGDSAMFANNTSVRTEVRGLEIQIEGSNLVLSADGSDLVPPIRLTTEDAERLRIEMAKAQLWEWNQLEELRSRAVLRYRRYLASVAGTVRGCVQCLYRISQLLPQCFSVPAVDLPLVESGLRQGQAERDAAAERRAFVPEWNYVRQRMEESETTPPASEGPSRPSQ